MKAKTYHISIGSVGPFNCRAASPRKAIEATVSNPDEVAIIWRTSKIGNLYRIYYEDGNTNTIHIGYVRIAEEVDL